MKEPVKWLTPAPSAEPRMPRGAIGGPAFFVSKRRAGIYGCAMTTDPTLNCAGLAQAQTRQWFHENHLFAMKRELTKTLAKLRRDHRATSSALTGLKAVTNELLAMGDR